MVPGPALSGDGDAEPVGVEHLMAGALLALALGPGLAAGVGGRRAVVGEGAGAVVEVVALEAGEAGAVELVPGVAVVAD